MNVSKRASAGSLSAHLSGTRSAARHAFASIARFTVVGVLLLLVFAPSGPAATFTVSNLNNNGAGSLRQAILGC